MHLENWMNHPVGDPLPFFRNALASISLNATRAPGQQIVQNVLAAVFLPQGFSTTLQQNTFAQIHAKLGQALRGALGPSDVITPGFEDMIPPRWAQQPTPPPAPVGPPPVGQPGPKQRDALEEALGAAFIDRLNSYSVPEDLTQAFLGYGGTDPHIQDALRGTFNPDFTTKLQTVDIGPTASVAMNTLAKLFGAQLRASVAHGGAALDPEFADLYQDLPR
jgi:hypothetical protein